MAGIRIGYALGSEELIRAINDVKYSYNSYTMSRPAITLGKASIEDDAYFRATTAKIIETREWFKKELAKLGFSFPDSKANFVFAAHPKIGGVGFYLKLREKGILVRHFGRPERIVDYNRITVGSREQTDVFEKAVDGILEEIL